MWQLGSTTCEAAAQGGIRCGRGDLSNADTGEWPLRNGSRGGAIRPMLYRQLCMGWEEWQQTVRLPRGIMWMSLTQLAGGLVTLYEAVEKYQQQMMTMDHAMLKFTQRCLLGGVQGGSGGSGLRTDSDSSMQ